MIYWFKIYIIIIYTSIQLNSPLFLGLWHFLGVWIWESILRVGIIDVDRKNLEPPNVQSTSFLGGLTSAPFLVGRIFRNMGWVQNAWQFFTWHFWDSWPPTKGTSCVTLNHIACASSLFTQHAFKAPKHTRVFCSVHIHSWDTHW